MIELNSSNIAFCGRFFRTVGDDSQNDVRADTDGDDDGDGVDDNGDDEDDNGVLRIFLSRIGFFSFVISSLFDSELSMYAVPSQSFTISFPGI